jgi:hypothetical protein
MTTTVPFLRIEQDLSSRLELVSANRRWLLLISALAFSIPLIGVSALLFANDEVWIFGIAGIVTSLLILTMILLFTPYKAQLTFDSFARKISLIQHYWLGLGTLERIREKTWSYNDFTDINQRSQGWKKLVEIESNGKKELLLDFGRKAKDAQRSFDLLQSWISGIAPDSSNTTTALQELENNKQIQSTLKNAEKLLYYFGGFSLLAGLVGIGIENLIDFDISIATMINIFTGLTYLACGYAAKHRSEIALWVAILVVLAERLYWFIISGSLSGNGNWSSWLTWVFAIFVVTSLWQAIKSIRAMEENPVYEPLP